MEMNDEMSCYDHLTRCTRRLLGLKTVYGRSMTPDHCGTGFQIGKDEYSSLAEANDCGRMFAEIAVAVEAQSELFFKAQDTCEDFEIRDKR